ncbi:hypothetical protein ACLKA7_008299 [Drosophila subpalustris]
MHNAALGLLITRLALVHTLQLSRGALDCPRLPSNTLDRAHLAGRALYDGVVSGPGYRSTSTSTSTSTAAGRQSSGSGTHMSHILALIRLTIRHSQFAMDKAIVLAGRVSVYSYSSIQVALGKCCRRMHLLVTRTSLAHPCPYRGAECVPSFSYTTLILDYGLAGGVSFAGEPSKCQLCRDVSTLIPRQTRNQNQTQTRSPRIGQTCLAPQAEDEAEDEHVPGQTTVCQLEIGRQQLVFIF